MIFSYILILLSIILEPLMEKTYLPGFLVLLQILIIIYYSLFKKKQIHKINLLLFYYLLFMLGITLISNPSSYYGYAIRIFTCFLQLVVGVQFFTIFMESVEKRKTYIKMFLTIITFLSLYIIYEGVTNTNPLFGGLFREEWQTKIIYGYARGYRAAGSMESPLVMSVPMVIVFFIAYLKLRLQKQKYYIFPSLAILIGSIFLQARIILILIFLVILGVEFLVLSMEKNLKSYVKRYIFILLIFYFFIRYWNNIVELFTSNSMSYIHRFTSIQFVWHEILNSHFLNFLFGKGYGSLSYKVFSEQITITDVGFYAIDNEFITILFEFGLLGVLVGIMLLFNFLIKLKGKNRNIIFYNLSIIFILLFYMFSFNIFHWYSLTVIISMIIAYLICINKKENILDEI